MIYIRKIAPIFTSPLSQIHKLSACKYFSIPDLPVICHLLLFSGVFLSCISVAEARRYAAIVIDADTGKVLPNIVQKPKITPLR